MLGRLKPFLLPLCFLGLLWFSFASQAQTIEPQDADDRPASEAEVSPPVDMWDRLRRGFAMPELRGERVNVAIRFYANKPDYIHRVTTRASKYLYHIAEEVERRGMPTELVLLPFVESAFQPEALSHARASGLWQFMPATGRTFDLQQNRWKDERRDILESTRAALDYFEKLYAMFGDWHLALAAYNWGEGSVSRAIKRAENAGLPTDYAHLRMPKETANYVPKLQAIKEIISHPEFYGITLPEVENEPYFVQITKNRDIDLKTAAELSEMELSEFTKLNPGFNLPVIVASHNSVMLLPIDKLETFMDNLASWVNTGKPLSSWLLYPVKENETLATIATKTGMSEAELRRVNRIPSTHQALPGSLLLVDANGQMAPDIAAEALHAKLQLTGPRVTSRSSTSGRRIIYRVRHGDTLYSIAQRYGVSQASLRQNNKLRASQLRIGQRLIITSPTRGVSNTAVTSSKSTSTKSRNASASTRKVRSTNSSVSTRSTGTRRYRVRTGDTLFSIAKRYRVSLAELKRLNGLKNNHVKVGRALKIP